ncbi:DUF4197 domain-containing protein [Novosphingobium sp.]|uniref:DUF4197 domain-containing protein n=1 Tax=Novosphingobium sp. TaxID=1874826 RepID=UPI0035B3DBCD
MSQREFPIKRRMLLLGLAALPFAAGAQAQVLGSGLTGLLGKASDSALDKLAVPGAFYADPAVRIMLPLVGGAGGLLGQVLNQGSKLGLTDGLTRKLNDAAGLAAKEAKPVFRAAIGRLTLADVPGIATQNDGASQYLRRSAASELTAKLRPLVDSGLVKVGAYGALDKLAKKGALAQLAGISHEKLGASVTDQVLNGIFKYMGTEEAKLRTNPLKPAESLLKGILGN